MTLEFSSGLRSLGQKMVEGIIKSKLPDMRRSIPIDVTTHSPLSAAVKIHRVYFMFCGAQNRFRCPEKSAHIVSLKRKLVLSLINFKSHELFKVNSHSKEDEQVGGCERIRGIPDQLTW